MAAFGERHAFIFFMPIISRLNLTYALITNFNLIN
jgi:hypothetical protein